MCLLDSAIRAVSALCLELAMMRRNVQRRRSVGGWDRAFIGRNCHGPCLVTFFPKNNHQTAPTESLMMATSPLFSATLTTSHPCQTYIRPPSEFILYSDTTNKSSFLSLPLPTSTTCYLPQHNQSPTMLHACSMLQANHILHVPVLEVMGFSCHKDLWGFESALFGILRSTSIFIICSILLPYSLLNISLYVFVFICINTWAVVCNSPVQIST